MPRDVIMPALGMAQETGVIVAWHKKPGDAVSEGDVLFEVETDKATMEVEAQGSGYLGGVTAKEGDEVAVGKTIARISDSAVDELVEAESPAPDSAGTETLPEGKEVIMPTLGMAQDSGLLVAWLVEPGGKVGADDPLFEVETDKSTMEVPAGFDGYLAAQLAEAGEEVPTGQAIAIVSAAPPESPVVRSAASGAASAPAAAPAPASVKSDKNPPAGTPARAAPVPASPSGRILASPKARRLALQQGLDLARLVTAGHPQPFHVEDLEVLKALPADAATFSDAPAGGPATRHLTAELPTEAFAEFADWAATQVGLDDPAALLAGLAGGCLDRDNALVAHEALGRRRIFSVPRGVSLRAVAEAEGGTPDLVLRDLRLTRISALTLGAEEAPTLTLTRNGEGLILTLECAAGHLSAPAAVSLLSDFAGRLEQPLRALL